MGCGSTDFVARDASCSPGASFFHVKCSDILSGSMTEKAEQCSAHCLSYSGYVAFSVQNSTSCVCSNTMPSVSSSSTQPDDCSDSNVVFSIKEHLRPNSIVRFIRSDQLTVTAAGPLIGFKAKSNNSLNQNFLLVKCSLADVNATVAACVGQASAWKSTAVIESGDIVAWVGQEDGRAFSCEGASCTPQSFPPGNLAAIFAITKATGHGTISSGDDIIFTSALDKSQVVCGTRSCGLATSTALNPIDGGRFKVEKALQSMYLSSNAVIKLMKGNTEATFNGMQQNPSGMVSNWYLAKCDGGPDKCIPSFANLNSVTLDGWGSPGTILSNDTVALVNQDANGQQAMNCIYDDVPCILLEYPPEPGYQGAYFKIVKVIDDVPVEAGTPIKFGDEVYFYSMKKLQWEASRLLDCNRDRCRVSTDSGIPESKFSVVEATKTTCALYSCPSGSESRLANAASTVFTEQNCCDTAALAFVRDPDDSGISSWALFLILLGAALCCICLVWAVLLALRKTRSAREQRSYNNNNNRRPSIDEQLISARAALDEEIRIAFVEGQGVGVSERADSDTMEPVADYGVSEPSSPLYAEFDVTADEENHDLVTNTMLVSGSNLRSSSTHDVHQSPVPPQWWEDAENNPRPPITPITPTPREPTPRLDKKTPPATPATPATPPPISATPVTARSLIPDEYIDGISDDGLESV